MMKLSLILSVISLAAA
jgi:hypothetical protein